MISTNTIIYCDFKTLRHSYLEVKTFLENEIGVKVPSLKTKIDRDLGCAGDDNYELLEKFIITYNLNSSGFDYSKHFLSEGELFGSTSALITLVSIPISLLLWAIKILTFGKINLDKLQLFSESERQPMDMTFGDLLTWYLVGKYCLREDTTFIIKDDR
ncbi:DUF1493 family protein [Lacibacter luteus]|uniref:DUF1493 family protein n=1 Tax=Lacibacter luteus TaxID=2508719 RepID=A0A4Q1CF55_9BACT|nr:DUF1493 family protein [Lacibacter luteus]RXK58313.1 DUF1493 family protein [Lacibacter luteus]